MQKSNPPNPDFQRFVFARKHMPYPVSVRSSLQGPECKVHKFFKTLAGPTRDESRLQSSRPVPKKQLAQSVHSAFTLYTQPHVLLKFN